MEGVQMVQAMVKALKNERSSISGQQYTLHFKKGTIAERNIENILKKQEKCFSDICKELDFESKLNIDCYLFESPYECGARWSALNPGMFKEGEEARMNAFALYPNMTFCTCTKECYALGPHEDTHLIMMEMFQDHPHSTFILEGIAVATGHEWWGMDLHQWGKHLVENQTLDSLEELLEEEVFFRNSSSMTYPLAGSYTRWFLDKVGIKEYKNLYQISIDSKEKMISTVRETLPDYRVFLSEAEGDPAVQEKIKEEVAKLT